MKKSASRRLLSKKHGLPRICITQSYIQCTYTHLSSYTFLFPFLLISFSAMFLLLTLSHTRFNWIYYALVGHKMDTEWKFAVDGSVDLVFIHFFFRFWSGFWINQLLFHSATCKKCVDIYIFFQNISEDVFDWTWIMRMFWWVYEK